MNSPLTHRTIYRAPNGLFRQLITHSLLPSKASSYPNFKDEEIKVPKVFKEQTSGVPESLSAVFAAAAAPATAAKPTGAGSLAAGNRSGQSAPFGVLTGTEGGFVAGEKLVFVRLSGFTFLSEQPHESRRHPQVLCEPVIYPRILRSAPCIPVAKSL